jgi:hypothetical protein
MSRAKCLKDHWVTVCGKPVKDPDITLGKFYPVIEQKVISMGADTMMSVKGDMGEEVVRPKHLFKLF